FELDHTERPRLGLLMSPHSSLSGGLLLIARNPADRALNLLPPGGIPDNVSVVLIQDAVGASGIPAPSVHVLEEDLQSRKQTSPYPRITYSRLVRMMFDAKRVIVL